MKCRDATAGSGVSENLAAIIRQNACTAHSDIMGDGETSMTEQLADKKCVPCRGGVPPLQGRELQELLKAVPQWNVIAEHHLTREFKFSDFKQALNFVNKVGELAEEQGHHPDILLAWGKAEITLWTHKIDGLTESDFIMAAKINRLQKG
jgi:4a-hydroxytetrahydrobiopterin dehydratase